MFKHSAPDTFLEDICAAGRKRGFASMDPAQLREIASKGGRSAHALGRAHKFTSEEAREAGRKGLLSRGRKA